MKDASATAEVYLPEEGRLAPLAVSLTAPRSRFQAFVLDGPAGPTVYPIGGTTGPAEAETSGYGDIERLAIEKR